MHHKTSLRKVGGSVMLAVPPALLELLQLRAGSMVGIAVDGGRLVVEPQTPPRYTLAALLAQCDGTIEAPDDEGGWLDAAPVGREIL